MKHVRILILFLLCSFFVWKTFLAYNPVSVRYITCSRALDYDKSLLSLSVSGCYYSKFVFMLFLPFSFVSPEYVDFLISSVLFSILLLNLWVITKISKRLDLSINHVLLLYGLFCFVFLDNDSIIPIFLVDLAFLLFVRKTRRDYFFCGLLLGLAGLFKPFALFVGGSLIIVWVLFNVKFTLKRLFIKNFNFIIFLFFGLLSTAPLYLYSGGYLQTLYYSSIGRVIDWSIFLTFEFFLVGFTVVLTFFKRNKSFFDFLLIIVFIFLIGPLSYVGSGFRFLSESFLFFVLPLVYYVRDFKFKFYVILFLLIIFGFSLGPFVKNVGLNFRSVIFNQVLAIDRNVTVLTDTQSSIYFELTHKLSVPLTDTWLFRQFTRELNVFNRSELWRNYSSYFNFSSIDVILSGPDVFSDSSLRRIAPSRFLNHSVIIFNYYRPNCGQCNNLNAILFSNSSLLIDFLKSLYNYWRVHSDELCAYSPTLYENVRLSLSNYGIYIPFCAPHFDFLFFEDYSWVFSLIFIVISPLIAFFIVGGNFKILLKKIDF